MWHRGRIACLLVTAMFPGAATAGSHHWGVSRVVHVGGSHRSGHTMSGLGWSGGSYVGPGGFWGAYAPAIFGAPPMPMFVPTFVPVFDPGMAAGPMPAVPAPRPAVASRARKADPTRSAQLVTIGDRLFRAGNSKRAAERYEQAVRADPNAAEPRARLAEVALVRGQFSEAARRIRESIDAQPGWLDTAKDVQSLFAEPGDFTKLISRLESHLLTEPGDRDAWLVLGTQLYLSGQTRRASDVFIRLTDRKPDPALAAFLDATGHADLVRSMVEGEAELEVEEK